MPILEARSGVRFLTGPPQNVHIGGDDVALLGPVNFMEELLLPQVNEEEIVSNRSPINSIESTRNIAKVEEMKWNNDLQVFDLLAEGGVIAGLVATQAPISRREFLKLAGIAAAPVIALAGCSTDIRPYIYPTPTPSKDKYPPPIPDAEYQKLTNRARITKLVSGNIPESWKDLAPRELITKFEAEIRKILLPELCSVLGCTSQDIKENLHFVYTKQDMIDLLIKKGKSSQEAGELADQVIGINVENIDTTTGKVSQRYIAIQMEESVKIWENGQRELVGKFPNVSYLKERAYLNSNIIKSAIDTVIHESIHYLQERYKSLSGEESERLKRMYAGRISEKGRSISPDKFMYTHGAQLILKDTDDKSYRLNEDLLESYRAYTQEYVLEAISQGIVTDPQEMLHKLTARDLIQAVLLKNLHGELSINPNEMISTYRDRGFLALVDLYRDKAGNKITGNNERIVLADEDIAVIFIKISQADNELVELFNKKEYKLGVEFEIATKYWTKIKLLLDAKKTRAISNVNHIAENVSVFVHPSLQPTLQSSYA